MRAIVLFFLVSGMLTACGGSDNNEKNNPKDKLQIISTIKPVQAIVLAIAGEYAQSEQLIPDYASPHNYSFKPSDIRKMKSADVVFRIDEHMESQLNAAFENLETNTKLISLADAEGLKLLEPDDAHHNSDKGHEKEAKDGHENIDFHIWTSARNASYMASAVTSTLIDLDAKNAKHYQQNFEIFKESLMIEFEKISALLSKYQNNGYVVFHNSWQYFADEAGLQKPIVVNLHEGFSNGAKTIGDIRSRIKEENIQCVFYDASVSESRLKLLTEQVKVKTVEIDVIAQGIEMNQTAYVNWLGQMGEQVESCLSAN